MRIFTSEISLSKAVIPSQALTTSIPVGDKDLVGLAKLACAVIRVNNVLTEGSGPKASFFPVVVSYK